MMQRRQFSKVKANVLVLVTKSIVCLFLVGGGVIQNVSFQFRRAHNVPSFSRVGSDDLKSL